MNIVFISLQIFVLFLMVLEFLYLRKNRKVFEELIIKFVEAGQVSFNNIDAHIKKISDMTSVLSKTTNNILSIKENIKILDGSVKEFQITTKLIKTNAQKEFKNIEDGIKKIKAQLK